MRNYKYSDISNLMGETLTKVEVNDENDRIDFFTESGRHFVMLHEQDCCESVGIEDICGDLQALVGSPILSAYESSNEPEPEMDERWTESYTWTFYIIRTMFASVTLRWLGESNGYYSESVDFEEVVN